MNTNKKLFYMGIPFVLLCLKCATDVTVAGGGTVVTNSFITGMIYSEAGTPAADAQVMLIPQDYNPYEQSQSVQVSITNTNTAGEYTFDADTGRYNIQARNASKGTQLLLTGINAVEENTPVQNGMLSVPGAIRIILPDSVDTANRYVYIRGTTVTRDVSSVKLLSGNHYALVIDSVPAAQLPAVLAAKKDHSRDPIVIADTVTVSSRDTVSIGITDTILKPLWRFSCIVGMTEQTSQYFGGLDAIKPLIVNQITASLKKCNDPGVFQGELAFVVDSIYQFATDAREEINTPFNGFDYRFIYDAYANVEVGSYYSSTRTIHMVWLTDGLFGQYGVDVLAWMIGRARGCIGLDWLNVKAQNNPVNHQAYTSVKSIMHYPYGETNWDTYSISVINYYADKVVSGSNLIHWAFPSSIRMIVRSANGDPIPNATISTYAVRWRTYTVDVPARYTGTTDSTGEYRIVRSPYDPDSSGTIDYVNFLITAEHENDTAYTWMPITEVINTWFADPDSACMVQIHF